MWRSGLPYEQRFHNANAPRKASADILPACQLPPRPTLMIMLPKMRGSATFLGLFTTLCMCLAAACGRAGEARELDLQSRHSSAPRFRPDSIALEEPQGVINVAPVVTVDSDSGFLVADLAEGQVRLYSPSGRLRNHFARKGRGPGEFDGISAVLRLPTREIVAIDMEGRIGIFTPDGRLLETQQTEFMPVYAAALLDSDNLVIAGRLNGRNDTDLVHVWNLRQKRIASSFFPVPPHPERFAAAYSFSGFADIATRGDTIAAVFALTDSVFFFNRSGERLGNALRIPASDFRRIRNPLLPNASRVERQAWLGSFSAVLDIFWTPDGRLIVQLVDREKMDARYTAVGLDREGRRLFEHTGTQLLAVTRDSMFFVHPRAEAPNLWSVASFSE